MHKIIPGNIRYVLWVLLHLLLLNSFMRLGLALYNGLHLKATAWEYLFTAFWVGIRFDLATLMLFNGLIFFLLLLPIPYLHTAKAYHRFNILILMINLPIIALNLVDIVYFGFAEKRLTHELFSIQPGDVATTANAGLIDFWWILIALGGLTYGLALAMWWATKRVVASPAAPRKWGLVPAWATAVMGGLLIFLCIRGGFQEVPLRPSMAFVTPNNFAGNLGLNSAYTVVSSLVLEKETEINLMDEDAARMTVRELIGNDFDVEWGPAKYPLLRRAEFPGPELRHNVVLIIVESLDALHVGAISGNDTTPSLTPFLDSLAQTGRLFTRFHANANRSIEALPAILNSMPDIYGRPLIGSAFESMQHWGLGNILEARGYQTSFFHGGRNGTMGFDNYSRISGLRDYMGKNEYPFSERDYDNHWGIWDSPFFSWWADELNQMEEPFFSVLFTISNHHPFSLPEKGYQDIKALPVTPYERTTAYTDAVLKEFWKKTDTMAWKDSTIFLITADHCFFQPSHPPQSIVAHSHIPLLMIGPGISPGVDHRIGNQLSILPTVIDYLRLDTWHASGAVSLLGDKPGFAITENMGIVTVLHDSLTWSTDFVRPRSYFFQKNGNWKKEDNLYHLPEPVQEKMDNEARAVFQTFKNIRSRNALIGGEYMKVDSPN